MSETIDPLDDSNEQPQADDVKEMMKAIGSVAFPNGRKDIEEGGTTVRSLAGDKLTQPEAEQLFSSVKALMLIMGASSSERITFMVEQRGGGKLTAEEAQAIGRFITGEPEGPLYSGGDGASPESAVVIHCTRTPAGIAVEREYVEKLYGERDVDWTMEGQFLKAGGGRTFSVLVIKLPNGETRTVHFDITAFFGRF